MFSSLSAEKGISLIEVLISLFLVSFGVLALLSLQPSAWQLTGKSDFLGRAGEVLHREMETVELLIMNPSNADPCAASNPLVTTTTVFPSAQTAAQPGDVPFQVVRTITRNAANNAWTVQVAVTLPGRPSTISETRVVTRQEGFRWP